MHCGWVSEKAAAAEAVEAAAGTKLPHKARPGRRRSYPCQCNRLRPGTTTASTMGSRACDLAVSVIAFRMRRQRKLSQCTAIFGNLTTRPFSGPGSPERTCLQQTIIKT